MREGFALPLRGNPKDSVAVEYLANAEAPRISTDIVVLQRLEQEYPDKEITIIPEASCDLLSFAAAGHATAIPDEINATNSGSFQWNIYFPPASRLNGGSGAIASQTFFGRYKYIYGDYQFTLYLIDGRDGTNPWPQVRNYYIVSDSANSAKSLILAAGDYGVTLHEQIWVFDQGYWQKDSALWASVQHASWDDVILDAGMKKAIIGDVNRFYDGRATYKRLRVPWKRGIIYHGPPGNGKTISIKATMNMLYKRKDPVPTLYVKTLSSFAGPEYSLNQIFGKARATAPCYLVFEDLDSIVSDSVRSFFLNQVDGLNNNDGILMVGSTNHLDRLDPGISKRPSRFDRKYLFPNPNTAERVQYAKFWRHKLLNGDSEDGSDENVEFPDYLCPAIARITDGFSFAYIQEAFVASLLAIASREIEGFEEDKQNGCGSQNVSVSTRSGDELPEMDHFNPVDKHSNDNGGQEHKLKKKREKKREDLERLVLWREIKSQVRILREEMGDGE